MKEFTEEEVDLIIASMNFYGSIEDSKITKSVMRKITPPKSKGEYYAIVCNITPSSCATMTFTAYISEDYKSFINRNQKKGDFSHFHLLFLKECTKFDYDLFSEFNPKSNSYLRLKKEDYGKDV